MKQEPRKHHYIPQFILRNFYNSDNLINYWDIETSKLETSNTKKIFMNVDMYRSEELYIDDPTQIEFNFSIFECEIAKLIAEKVLINSKKIVIRRDELEKLRIFISLLSFRSNFRMEQYKNSLFDPETKEILMHYQPDGNFENLWKNELNILAKCRTYKQIIDSDEIDPIIKKEFLNDLEGYYMTIAEARGGQFVLSDVYPTFEAFQTKEATIPMHYLLPLSPTRLLFLNHIAFKKECSSNQLPKRMLAISNIRGDLIETPKNEYNNGIVTSMDDEFVYKVKRIYEPDIIYINELILNEARVGIIFQDAKRVINSISSFNSRNDTKQNYLNLEKVLEE